MKRTLGPSALALAFILGACQPTETPGETTTQQETTSVSPETTTEVASTTKTEEETSTSAPEESRLLEDFEALLSPESTAADLANFMFQGNIYASPEEMETMLEWLLIYQTEPILDIGDKLYEEAYYLALNDTMGGQINPDKIQAIEDEDVRDDFQLIYDSFLTIVRYEETPVLETDWTRLLDYKDTYSTILATAMELRVERMTYNEDYRAIAEKVYGIENLIELAETPYARQYIIDLHSLYVGDLLVGPEGSYLTTFMYGEDDFYTGDLYKALVDFAATHPETEFAQLITELDKGEWETFIGPNNLINDYLTFGYNSPLKWTYGLSPFPSGYQKLVLRADDYPELESKVNKAIDDKITEMLASVDNPVNYGLYTYTSGNKAGLTSLSISINYMATPDQTKYLSDSITFDLATGDILSITDLLQMDEAAVIATINALSGANYNALPKFSYAYESIFLNGPTDEDQGKTYTVIPLKDLVPYVKHELLLQQ